MKIKKPPGKGAFVMSDVRDDEPERKPYEPRYAAAVMKIAVKIAI